MTEEEKNTFRRRDTDYRLDNIEKSVIRMENTLLELSKAMISLARVEERLAASHEKTERMERDIGAMQTHITHITRVNAV